MVSTPCARGEKRSLSPGELSGERVSEISDDAHTAFQEVPRARRGAKGPRVSPNPRKKEMQRPRRVQCIVPEQRAVQLDNVWHAARAWPQSAKKLGG